MGFPVGTEVEGIDKRWYAFQAVPDLVDRKFEYGMDKADGFYTEAKNTINELKDIADTLNEIDITAGIPELDLPDVGTFTGEKPNTPDLTVNFPDAPSDADDLQSATHDFLIDSINNQSQAISETVETAIFERNQERDQILLDEALDKISEEWAKRGFTLPNGMLNAALSQATVEHMNKRMDVSRDVAIKNFELSDANVKFAIQQGMAWVLQRITLYKAQVEAEAARIDAVVKAFMGEVEVYKGEAQVYMTLVDAVVKKYDAQLKTELAKADILIKNAEIEIENYKVVYGLKAEAMKAIGAINAQMVAGALASVNATVHLSAGDEGSYVYNTNPSY